MIEGNVLSIFQSISQLFHFSMNVPTGKVDISFTTEMIRNYRFRKIISGKMFRPRKFHNELAFPPSTIGWSDPVTRIPEGL